MPPLWRLFNVCDYSVMFYLLRVLLRYFDYGLHNLIQHEQGFRLFEVPVNFNQKIKK